MHDVILVVINHLDKQIRDLRIELASPAAQDFRTYLLLRTDVGIGPVACHGIIGVRHGYDPGFFRDLCSQKAVRIPAAVKALMMPPGACCELRKLFDVFGISEPMTGCSRIF